VFSAAFQAVKQVCDLRKRRRKVPSGALRPTCGQP
jgi:hypothetical protein